MSPLFRARTPKSRYIIEPDHLPVLAWLGVSFVLAMISTAAPQFGQSMKNAALTVIAPIVEVVEAPLRSISDSAQNISQWTRMSAELEELRIDNERLMGWYHKAKRLEAENEQLRKNARRVNDPVQSFVTARVVMDQDQAYLRTALVAAGRSNGIESGQAVLAKQALAGRVLEVSEHVSRLLLVTDASSRIPVMVENTGQRAIMAGNNSSEPELLYVPDGEILTNGARIVTSGHGGVFPPYIPIGVVKKDKDNNYKVILFADLDALDLVRIVNYELKIDLPVERSTQSAPARMTDLPGNKKDNEKMDDSEIILPEKTNDEGDQ